jgi:hypothetical protein
VESGDACGVRPRAPRARARVVAGWRTPQGWPRRRTGPALWATASGTCSRRDGAAAGSGAAAPAQEKRVAAPQPIGREVFGAQRRPRGGEGDRPRVGRMPRARRPQAPARVIAGCALAVAVPTRNWPDAGEGRREKRRCLRCASKGASRPCPRSRGMDAHRRDGRAAGPGPPQWPPRAEYSREAALHGSPARQNTRREIQRGSA